MIGMISARGIDWMLRNGETSSLKASLVVARRGYFHPAGLPGSCGMRVLPPRGLAWWLRDEGTSTRRLAWLFGDEGDSTPPACQVEES